MLGGTGKTVAEPEPEVERGIRMRARSFERRLRARLGAEVATVHHYRRPAERPLDRAERERVTILFGGLTRTHDRLLRAAAESCGYRVLELPTPDNEALATGKEFGNRGQCNPTYYTVGNLLKFLRGLRDAGERNIEDRYAFLTIGSCGPCRFGMYESEYRKALTDAGFGRLRVFIIQQSSGLTEREPAAGGGAATTDEAGFRLERPFFLAMLRALIASDIVNAMAQRIRPYEVDVGATDGVLAVARDDLEATLSAKRSVWFALSRSRARFDRIEVDFTRVRPIVKITGEFWAQTTEGDGSYRLQAWLEDEGAQVLTEPVGTWIDYLLWAALAKTRERLGLRHHTRRRLLLLWCGLCLYKSFYTFYRSALRFRTPPLTSQRVMADRARNYYDPRLGGGEGHMEVGKHVLAVEQKKAHMVASIKPFGCMPSTQSDGIQTKVVADLPGSIFIPIETSGDGEVNVKSRVQMKLFEARERARAELDGALKERGLSLEQVREAATRQPQLRRAMLQLPHRHVGTAANFVELVADRLGCARSAG